MSDIMPAAVNRPFPDKPSGTGGWLFILILGLTVFGPFQGFRTTSEAMQKVEEQTAGLADNPVWEKIKLVWWAGMVITAACGLAAGLLLAIRHKRSTPHIAMILILALGFLPAIVEYVGFYVIWQPYAQAVLEPLVVQAATGALYFVVWGTYLWRSKRVRNTYIED